MIDQSLIRRLLLGAATGLALAVTGVSVPIVAGSLTPAMAQTSEDMTAALEAYGHWVRHASYGEVWVPDGVPPDWQPYQYGHWVFTDDWGWYWVSDENEDDWGWVVYHYGRWAFDRAIGWFWVPGDEWAPAWVDWRYGGDNVGWAPLPPDDLVDAYDEQPDYWVYVPLRYIGEPQLRSHFMPRDRSMIMLRETRLINRPVRVEGRRLWVNPGLAPGFIAGRTHVALHAYQVRPRVFGATTSVQGAVIVRQQDLRIKGEVRRAAPITVQRSTTTIQAATTTAAPQPLGKGEQGRARAARQPSAARRAGRRRSATAAATTATAAGANRHPAHGSAGGCRWSSGRRGRTSGWRRRTPAASCRTYDAAAGRSSGLAAAASTASGCAHSAAGRSHTAAGRARTVATAATSAGRARAAAGCACTSAASRARATASSRARATAASGAAEGSSSEAGR